MRIVEDLEARLRKERAALAATQGAAPQHIQVGGRRRGTLGCTGPSWARHAPVPAEPSRQHPPTGFRPAAQTAPLSTPACRPPAPPQARVDELESKLSRARSTHEGLVAAQEEFAQSAKKVQAAERRLADHQGKVRQRGGAGGGGGRWEAGRAQRL